MLLLTGGHGRTTSRQSRHATTRQVQFFNGCGPIEDDPYFWFCCRSSKTGYQCDWRVVCGLDAVWASRVNVLNGTKLRSRRVLTQIVFKSAYTKDAFNGVWLPSSFQTGPIASMPGSRSTTEPSPSAAAQARGHSRTLSLTPPLVRFHGRTK